MQQSDGLAGQLLFFRACSGTIWRLAETVQDKDGGSVSITCRSPKDHRVRRRTLTLCEMRNAGTCKNVESTASVDKTMHGVRRRTTGDHWTIPQSAKCCEPLAIMYERRSASQQEPIEMSTSLLLLSVRCSLEMGCKVLQPLFQSVLLFPSQSHAPLMLDIFRAIGCMFSIGIQSNAVVSFRLNLSRPHSIPTLS